MHAPYCCHREGPHTLYYNDRHAFFSVLIAEIIRNAPQIQQSDTAYDFCNIKERNISESPIHQEASNNFFFQNRAKNKEVIPIFVMS